MSVITSKMIIISARMLYRPHILKAYDESYSKVIRGHKYKDKENDKDKNTDKVPETPDICYIFEILMTHSFQI